MEESTRLRKVAIADDSPAFLAAAANYVATLPGFMLAGIASTAPQALALVESATPDVLLLDLGLGPKRGLELVQRVQSAPAPTSSSARSASSRVFPRRWRGFFQALLKHRHFLFGLAVALRARGLDAARISLDRGSRLSGVLQGTAERLPCRGIQRIALDGVAQVLRGARRIARLRVLAAERVAQQRAVARRPEQLLKARNHWAKITRMKTSIQTRDAPEAIGTYSQAVRAGNTVYLSGQIGLDAATMQLAEGIEGQTHRVFRNLAAVAAAAGLGLEHAVRMTVYLTDLAHFARVNEIMAQYVREPYPSRAAVGVAGLPRGALVEIDAVLHRG